MEPSNFSHVISGGQEAYPVSLRQRRLVKMVVKCGDRVGATKLIIKLKSKVVDR